VRAYAWNQRPRLFVSVDMWSDRRKTVLDATAGLRQYWRGRDASRVLFLDLRREVLPDVVASNEFLPFQSGVFKEVAYDPPHIYGEKKGASYYLTGFGFRYWVWERKGQLLRNVVAVNREFARVLRAGGKVVLKWTDIPDQVQHDFVLGLLSNFELNGVEEWKSRSGTQNRTFLFTLVKKCAPRLSK